MRGAPRNEVVAVAALLERTSGSGGGGLGAKVFNGLRDRRGTIGLEGAASVASARSGDVDISGGGGGKPWERLASEEGGNEVLWKARQTGTVAVP